MIDINNSIENYVIISITVAVIIISFILLHVIYFPIIGNQIPDSIFMFQLKLNLLIVN